MNSEVKYLEAVDIVCLECSEGNDDVCVSCPVRITCESMAKVEDK